MKASAQSAKGRIDVFLAVENVRIAVAAAAQLHRTCIRALLGSVTQTPISVSPLIIRGIQ